MFECVVKKLGACCYVYHNNDLAFFIDSRKEGEYVDPNKRQPCLAVSIWGDHGFMYTGERARKMREAHPKPRDLCDTVRISVLSHNYVDKSCPFDKQIELSIEDLRPLLDLVEAGKEATFYFEDLRVARAHLRAAGVRLKSHSGACPDDLLRLSVLCKRPSRSGSKKNAPRKPPNITIKPLHKDARLWQTFCPAFSKITSRKLIYTGGSGTAIMTSALPGRSVAQSACGRGGGSCRA